MGYQHAEYLLGLIFMHISQLWYPAWIPAEPTNKLYSAFDQAGVTSAWRFVGYWLQPIAGLPNNIKASVYVAPDGRRALVLAMNLNWEDITTELRVADWVAVGLTERTQATTLYHRLPAQFHDGVLQSVTIAAKNFRLYLVGQQAELVNQDY